MFLLNRFLNLRVHFSNRLLGVDPMSVNLSGTNIILERTRSTAAALLCKNKKKTNGSREIPPSSSVIDSWVRTVCGAELRASSILIDLLGLLCGSGCIYLYFIITHPDMDNVNKITLHFLYTLLYLDSVDFGVMNKNKITSPILQFHQCWSAIFRSASANNGNRVGGALLYANSRGSIGTL